MSDERLPKRLIEAANRFVAFDEEDDSDIDVATNLILGYGIPKMEPDALRRGVALCLLGARRILHGWSLLGCEGNRPEQVLDHVARWIQTGEYSPDWASLCLPAPALFNGRPIQDCDACRVEPIASAAARTALFAKTANPVDGAIALCDIRGAVLEGLDTDDDGGYENWLINVAVPAAYNLDLVNGA
jgi:hypothetical protein